MQAVRGTLLPKTYREGRIPPVLRHVLRKRGWSPTAENFVLYWKNGRLTSEERASCREGQFFNHFPDSHWITKKGHLQNLLKYAQVKYGDAFNFFPRSWIFSKFSQDIILKYEAGREAKLDEKTLWIGKPSSSSRGRGIVLTHNLKDFTTHLDLIGRKEVDVQAEKPKADYDLIVVQEYIKNPHLIAGYKYDLRLYVLVRSFNPLVAYIYDDGLVRFCSKPYCEEDTDLLRHLTNSSIQQKVVHTGYLTPEEETAFNEAITPLLGEGDFAKRTLRSLLAHMHQEGIDYKKVWKEIIHVITLSLLALAPGVKTSPENVFELFGFDIMLTADMKPKLIEVNLAPSLAVSGPTDHVVKQPLVSDLLDLVFGPDEDPSSSIKPHSKILSDSTLPSVGGFNQFFPFNAESSSLITNASNSALISECGKKWLE